MGPKCLTRAPLRAFSSCVISRTVQGMGMAGGPMGGFSVGLDSWCRVCFGMLSMPKVEPEALTAFSAAQTSRRKWGGD